MSVIGVPTLLGPILGPVIGGLIVDNVSWRWIFFVNLPVGAIALALAARILPRTEVRGRSPLDVRGMLLLSPGLALLIYGLSEVGAAGSFGDWHVLVGVLGGAALLVGFALLVVARARHADRPVAVPRPRVRGRLRHHLHLRRARCSARC